LIAFVSTFVPHAADGQNQGGIVGILLDLLPQPADMDIHRARLHETILTPDLVQQLGPREHAAAMAKKELQQPKLHGGEIDGVIVLGDFVTGWIQTEASEADWGFAWAYGRSGSTQDRLDSRHQLPWAEGLGYVVVRPNLQGRRSGPPLRPSRSA